MKTLILALAIIGQQVPRALEPIRGTGGPALAPAPSPAPTPEPAPSPAPSATEETVTGTSYMVSPKGTRYTVTHTVAIDAEAGTARVITVTAVLGPKAPDPAPAPAPAPVPSTCYTLDPPYLAPPTVVWYCYGWPPGTGAGYGYHRVQPTHRFRRFRFCR